MVEQWRRTREMRQVVVGTGIKNAKGELAE
jgi:hypothetical protein